MLIEDWCQQFPSHSIGDLDFGPDGALYVSGGDGAELQRADYGQNGSPLNPCGDPPAGRRDQTPPTAEGGALRAQDLRTSGDPIGARRRDPPDRPRHGRRPAGNPLARRARPQRPPDHRPRPPQPVPVHVPAGHRRDLGRRRRLERLGGDRPDHRSPDGAPSTNFGWPCYEGTAAGRLRQRRTCDSARTLYGQSMRQSAVSTPTATATRAAEDDGRARAAAPRSPASPSTPERRLYPASLPRRAVLRRLLAELHLGHAGGRQRRARPQPRAGVPAGGPEPGRPDWAPMASSTTSTWAAAPRRIRYFPTTRRRSRSFTACRAAGRPRSR